MRSTIKTAGISALAFAAVLGGGCSAGEESAEVTTEAPASMEASAPAAAPAEPAMEEASAEMAEEPAMEEAPAEEAEPMQMAMAETAQEEPAAEAEMTEASASGDLPADHPALGGDATAGKRVFFKCMSCHAVKEGQNKVGPSLYGIVGRPAGSVDGFNYSDANANSGIVWTKDVMFEYLEAPQEYIPGTRMIFPGLPSEKDRRDVIAYLESVAE